MTSLITQEQIEQFTAAWYHALDVHAQFEGGRALVTLIVEAIKNDDSVHRYRNIRYFSHDGRQWVLDSWYNYEIPEL